MKTIIHLTGAALIGMALSAQAADFAVSSPGLKPGGTLPTKHVLNGFGCTGGNISPALSWHNAPAGTQSFAITAYDPDAPTGSGWWHWVAYEHPRPPRNRSAKARARPTASSSLQAPLKAKPTLARSVTVVHVRPLATKHIATFSLCMRSKQPDSTCQPMPLPP